MGSTTLEPGEEGTLTIPEHNHEGKHLFEITMESNDPVEPRKKIYFSFETMPAE